MSSVSNASRPSGSGAGALNYNGTLLCLTAQDVDSEESRWSIQDLWQVLSLSELSFIISQVGMRLPIAW
jgi:hypothetical protein